MASDTLGYPIKKHFYRTNLEKAWIAAFGALDIGDFDIFLKESADRTYADALKQIEIIGGRSESRQVKEAKEEFEKGGIEQYRLVAEELRKEGKEYEASAIDALIADLIAEQSKPRRKAQERKPKPAIQQLPFIALEKAPTDYISKLCKKSPLSQAGKTELINTVELHDIERAIKIIKECPHDTLDEFDKFELEERLRQKEMGITMPYKEGILKTPTKSKTTTMTDIISRREKEEPEVPHRRRKQEEEYTREQARITERAGTARADTARNIAEQLKSKISEILRYGLREYIQKNNIDIPVNNILLTMLAEELISIWFTKVREPANVREAIGQAIVGREGVMLLASGIEYIKNSNTMRQMYDLAKADNRDIPDFDVVVKDVANTILRIK